MSTHIKTIKGKKNTEISVTRFWGGEDGTLIQVTPMLGTYSVLNKKQAVKLAKTLLNSFDHKIHPSE
jgi:hypothetical protein